MENFLRDCGLVKIGNLCPNKDTFKECELVKVGNLSSKEVIPRALTSGSGILALENLPLRLWKLV